MVEDKDYKPNFMCCSKRETGEHPCNLLLGFENELSVRKAYGEEFLSIEKIVKEQNFLYIKEDLSVSEYYNGIFGDGVEINSYPFNWNWMMKNKNILDVFDTVSQKECFLGTEKMKMFNETNECAFHVHISSAFLNIKHQIKLAKFFYNNQDFIKFISKRYPNKNMSKYANLYLPKEYENNVESFINNSFGKVKNKFFRYRALNFTNKDTIEIRIFKGTLNKNKILSYLELSFAMVMFIISKDSVDNTNIVEDFIKYIDDNGYTYAKTLL